MTTGSPDPNDPNDPHRPPPLDYASGRGYRSTAGSWVRGCLIALAVLVLIVGVFFGACLLMIRH